MSKEIPSSIDPKQILPHIDQNKGDTDLIKLIAKSTVENNLVEKQNSHDFSVNFANAVLGIIHRSQGDQHDAEDRIVATADFHSHTFGIDNREDLVHALRSTIVEVLTQLPI